MNLKPCHDCKAPPSLANQETIGDGKFRCNKCRAAHFRGVFKKMEERAEERRIERGMKEALALRAFLRGD